METWRAEEWDRRQSTKVHLESAHANFFMLLVFSSCVSHPTFSPLPQNLTSNSI